MTEWCRTFQLMVARHANRLAEVRMKYGEEKANQIIEWARKKCAETPASFWNWLETAQRRVDDGSGLN